MNNILYKIRLEYTTLWGRCNSNENSFIILKGILNYIIYFIIITFITIMYLIFVRNVYFYLIDNKLKFLNIMIILILLYKNSKKKKKINRKNTLKKKINFN